MWTRAELKQRARQTFRLNYWKCVLVALIFAVVGGSGGSSSSISSSISNLTSGVESDSEMSESPQDIANAVNSFIDGVDTDMITAFVVIFITVFIVVLVIATLLDIFLLNVLEVGCNRFFVRNLHEKAQIGNVGFSFDTNYLNAVGTMFFKDLFTALWTLLFIIPGIVKSYEYRLIPYILAENPDMSRREIFATSKNMMRGNKWKAFVLDLSFIGWHILSAFTCGILEVFYVAPYVCATNAAFYEAVAYGPMNGNTAQTGNAGFVGGSGYAGSSDYDNNSGYGTDSSFGGNDSAGDRYGNSDTDQSYTNGTGYGDNSSSTDNSSDNSPYSDTYHN